MNAAVPKQIIIGYGIRLLYIFSLAFFGLNLIFTILYLFFIDWTGFYNLALVSEWVDTSAFAMLIAISFLGFIIVVITGIIFLMLKKKGGIYLFYSGNAVLIILLLLRSDPDWLSSFVIIIISVLFFIPVKIIGNHSKLKADIMSETVENLI